MVEGGAWGIPQKDAIASIYIASAAIEAYCAVLEDLKTIGGDSSSLDVSRCSPQIYVVYRVLLTAIKQHAHYKTVSDMLGVNQCDLNRAAIDQEEVAEVNLVMVNYNFYIFLSKEREKGH